MKQNYCFPWHGLQSAPQRKAQSWWNNISETENELLRLSSLMLVTLRFTTQHNSWPFGVTFIAAKVQAARVVFRKHEFGGNFTVISSRTCFRDHVRRWLRLGKEPWQKADNIPGGNPPSFPRWLGEKWTDVLVQKSRNNHLICIKPLQIMGFHLPTSTG